ncbi:MAG: hypothetical protein ACRDYE_12115, partial [Acidimicrobiales bacterium]
MPGRHGVEEMPGPSTEGSVMVDIGGCHGAAVIYAPAALDGSELELRRMGRAWDGTHTSIRRRDLREGTCYAGLFGSLPAGKYEVRIRGDVTGPTRGIAVVAGELVQFDWPS